MTRKPGPFRAEKLTPEGSLEVLKEAWTRVQPAIDMVSIDR